MTAARSSAVLKIHANCLSKLSRCNVTFVLSVMLPRIFNGPYVSNLVTSVKENRFIHDFERCVTLTGKLYI